MTAPDIVIETIQVAVFLMSLSRLLIAKRYPTLRCTAIGRRSSHYPQ
jgi:hypothetical protein